MSFTDEEIAYLQSQPLARVATVSPNGQPDVVPLAFEYDGAHLWIGGVGEAVLRTKKFRNIGSDNSKSPWSSMTCRRSSHSSRAESESTESLNGRSRG